MEGICTLIGSVLGAIGTGIAVYFTGSVFCALIGLAGYFIGSLIGKSIDKSTNK